MNLWLYLLGINAFTLLIYWLDKANARRGGGNRVPEYFLLLVGFAGGTLAAIVAQRAFRHKTKKLSFQFKFWALTMVQLMLLVLQPTELARIMGFFTY